METFILYFFSVDIRIRAAVLMALLIIVFWWLLGKIILRILSFFPYLLRGVFKGVYLLIEVPVCWIHGKAGSFFSGIDNGLATVGDKIDIFFKRWCICWYNPKSRHIFLSIVLYCIFLIWICIPYHADEANVKSFSGQAIYLKVENKLTDCLDLHNLYKKQVDEVVYLEKLDLVKEETITEDIAMKVITQKDSLAIRNIPSTENCEVLVRIEKDNIVFWKDEIAFGTGNNGSIEPWIKVETSNGIIGWARLIYLCPLNEKDFILKLH